MLPFLFIWLFYAPWLETLAPGVDAVYAGDASDRQTIERAGIRHLESVLLTTNDDAPNICLAVSAPSSIRICGS